MKTIFPHPILSFVLWLIWLLLNNTFAAGHMLLGAVLATVLPLMTLSFWPDNIRIQHPLSLFKFILIVIWDILLANIEVARLILGKNSSLESKFIEIPLEIQQPISISLLANTISLTPGTVSCDVSEDKKTLIVHALHSPEPSQTIAEIKQRYEQPLKKVFESC